MSVRDKVREAFRGPKVKPVESPAVLGLNGTKLGVRAITATERLVLEEMVGDNPAKLVGEKNVAVLTRVVILCVVCCEEDGTWVNAFTDDDADWLKDDSSAVVLMDLAQEAMAFNGVGGTARKDMKESFADAPASPSASA